MSKNNKKFYKKVVVTNNESNNTPRPKFKVGDVVKGKNDYDFCLGRITKVLPTSSATNTIRYVVNDNTHDHTFAESEVRKFVRKPMPPTEEEMQLIKTEMPYLKRGNVEVIYSQSKMLVFKFKNGNESSYGQILGSTFKQIDEKRYKFFENYVCGLK